MPDEDVDRRLRNTSMKDSIDDGSHNTSLREQAITAAVSAEDRNWRIAFGLIAAAAFGLYWLSAVVLEARWATTHFGADTWSYAQLASGDVWARSAADETLSRIARFHPVTIALIATWMEITKPLTMFLSPAVLLKALFAAVGAVGVWASTLAFSVVMPKRYAVLFGVIYATSLGVWYFSSIEESKIVTATLAAVYIAGYLKLRENWTLRGAVGLTVVLGIACLNEIVSGFLVFIPLVDTLVRRGWALREQIWVAAHALAAPFALIILETAFKPAFAADAADTEGASHVGMLLYYMTRNSHGWPEIHAFLSNWLFFNISAPTTHADFGVPAGADYRGYFEPLIMNYFQSPATVLPVIVFAVVIAICVLPKFRGNLQSASSCGHVTGIILGLLAYTVVRGTFFFIFNPPEPLLFSPAVTLAHLLIIGIAFVASTFFAKRLALVALIVGLIVANGSFILIPDPDEIGVVDDQQQWQEEPAQAAPDPQSQQQ
jgi:hypothetical protein